jgi:hypothetical protein
MSAIRIESTADAKNFVENCGLVDWEWTGNASLEGFAAWLRQNRSEVDRNDYDGELREYLTSVGENPDNYL